jgi:hypothetical protein
MKVYNGLLLLTLGFAVSSNIISFKNFYPKQNPSGLISKDTLGDTSISEKQNLYDSLDLGKLGLARRAYDYAMVGYKKLRSKGAIHNTKILSIIDFTLPSDKKRLFVLDLDHSKLLFATYVAHGKNSGLEKALYFSNEPESNKSSVGFYTTKLSYSGTHGYSLRLDGEEAGYNDNAEKRDIVVHSADYVDEAVAKQQGRIGRSLGCPALSPKINKQIIDKIKNGTCLFVYGQDNKYITNSKLLKQPVQVDSLKINP